MIWFIFESVHSNDNRNLRQLFLFYSLKDHLVQNMSIFPLFFCVNIVVIFLLLFIFNLIVQQSRNGQSETRRTPYAGVLRDSPAYEFILKNKIDALEKYIYLNILKCY